MGYFGDKYEKEINGYGKHKGNNNNLYSHPVHGRGLPDSPVLSDWRDIESGVLALGVDSADKEQA